MYASSHSKRKIKRGRAREGKRKKDSMFRVGRAAYTVADRHAHTLQLAAGAANTQSCKQTPMHTRSQKYARRAYTQFYLHARQTTTTSPSALRLLITLYVALCVSVCVYECVCECNGVFWQHLVCQPISSVLPFVFAWLSK